MTAGRMRLPAAVFAAAFAAGLAAFTAFTATSAGAAERAWVAVETPHFTVVSNAGEDPAQDIANQYEEVRAVFAAVWPWARREDGRPFYVIVARDEATLKGLVPEQWTERNLYGVYDARVDGEVADFAASRVDFGIVNPFGRENPHELAYEAYSDLAFRRHFGGRMPLWFREGLVELFGNVILGGKHIEVGRPLRGRIFELRGGIAAAGRGNREDRRGHVAASRKLLPLARLVTVREDDPEFTGDGERSVFNSQAWAFVHFLMFADGGSHRPSFNRMMDLLRAGHPGDEATREALGDVSRLDRAYLDYIDGPALQYQRIPATIAVEKRKWPARPLPAGEASAVLAHFHVAFDHPQQAREKVAEAKSLAPQLALAHEAEGLLLAREGDREAARAALQRARELGSTARWVAERLGERPAATAPAGAPAAGATAGPAATAASIAACNKGDDRACRSVAAVLQAACDGGDAPSCMPLGWLYVNGRGVFQNVFRGESYYGRACDAGEAKACAALARSILGRTAQGAERERANRLLARACEGGVTSACAVAQKD